MSKISLATFVVLRVVAAVAAEGTEAKQSVYTDFRGQSPGAIHKITPADLPKPYVSKSALNHARLVPRPKNAWPQAAPGFKVELYAEGLNNPRLIRTAPNGDLFLAESRPGRIKVFRGITPEAGGVAGGFSFRGGGARDARHLVFPRWKEAVHLGWLAFERR